MSQRGVAFLTKQKLLKKGSVHGGYLLPELIELGGRRADRFWPSKSSLLNPEHITHLHIVIALGSMGKPFPTVYALSECRSGLESTVREHLQYTRLKGEKFAACLLVVELLLFLW